MSLLINLFDHVNIFIYFTHLIVVEGNTRDPKHKFNPILLTYDNQLLEMNLRKQKFLTYFLNQRIIVVFIFTLSRTMMLILEPELNTTYEIIIHIILFSILILWIILIIVSYYAKSFTINTKIKIAKIELYLILPLFMTVENSQRWFLDDSKMETFYYDGVN